GSPSALAQPALWLLRRRRAPSGSRHCSAARRRVAPRIVAATDRAAPSVDRKPSATRRPTQAAAPRAPTVSLRVRRRHEPSRLPPRDSDQTSARAADRSFLQPAARRPALVALALATVQA